MDRDAALVELFLESNGRDGLSPSTVRLRRRQLALLQRHLGPLESWSRNRLQRFLGDRELAPASRDSYLSTISVFFGWAVGHDFLAEDPSYGIPRLRNSRNGPETKPVSDSDLREVIRASEARPRLWSALCCWISLAAYQGLKAHEMCALLAEELDLNADPPRLRLHDAKRSVELSEILHPEVLRHLEAISVPPAGPVFASASATSISQRVNRQFDRIGSSGTLTGIEAWYHAQVAERGKDFDRRATPKDVLSPEDARILDALEAEVPSAALSYRQSLRDLEDPNRVSYRGVANELRVAVWDVLEALAPDENVLSSSGFQLEQGRDSPTHKQRARHILRTRNNETREMTERSLGFVEDHVSAMTRLVYSRSSTTTHIPASVSEVRRVKSWVAAVLAQLLGL